VPVLSKTPEENPDMRTYKTVNVPKEVIDTSLCNKCGESLGIQVAEGITDLYGLHGGITGGYASPVLSDMTGYTFDLCEACLAALFATFKIPVGIEDNGESNDFAAYELVRITAVGRGEPPPKWEIWKLAQPVSPDDIGYCRHPTTKSVNWECTCPEYCFCQRAGTCKGKKT
jgi:hypothetical protein